MTDPKIQARDLLERAKSEPGTVDPAAIEEVLEADAGTDRNSALKVLAVVAHDDPDRVVDRLDLVVDHLTDPHLVARCTAAMVLARVARDRPERAVPAVPALVGLLDEEPPLLRYRAAGALAPIVDARPSAFVDRADALLDALLDGPTVDAETPTTAIDRATQATNRNRGDRAGEDRIRSKHVREVAANVLVEVGREDPDAVVGRVPDLVSLLSDDHEPVRAAIVEVVRHVAESTPAAVEPAIDPLVDLLDDDALVVRARAVRALGYAEATRAASDLERLAEADDGEIAAIAADTAEWLRGRG